MAILVIKVKGRKELRHIFNAERHLNKAGILFDAAYDCVKDERIWFLDESLEGATIKLSSV